MSKLKFAGFTIPPAIYAERRRQVEAEGWTPEHDDHHDDGSLLTVALVYHLHAVAPQSIPVRTLARKGSAPFGWPWGDKWWKPKTPRRDLERAGALCLAEAERLRRKDPRCSIVHVGHKLKAIVAALELLPT